MIRASRSFKISFTYGALFLGLISNIGFAGDRSTEDVRGLIQPTALEDTLEGSEIDFILSHFERPLTANHLLNSIRQGSREIPSGRGGQTARKWFLKDPIEPAWVLKEIPWYCAQKDQVLAITQIVAALRDKGLPIPRLIQSDSGSGYYQKSEDKFYILQEYLRGQFPANYLEKAAQVGQLLARFHQAGKSLVNTTALRQTSALESASHFLEIFEEEIESKQGPFSSETLQEIRSFLKMAKKEVNSLNDWDPQLLTILHGDLNPTNFLMSSNGQINGILDFDNLHQGAAVDDVAIALMQFAFFEFRWPTTRFTTILNEWKIEVAQQLIEGYLKEFKKTQAGYPDSEFFLQLRTSTLANGIRLFTLGFLNYSFALDQLDQFPQFLSNLKSGLDELSVRFGN